LFTSEIHASVKLQEFEWETTFQSDKFVEKYQGETAGVTLGMISR
jgi:hypothetical protein